MFENRSLVPPTFYYGGLHYVVLEVGAILPARIYGKLFDPKPETTNLEARTEWKNRLLVRTQRFARGVSALMATGQVFLAYLIGSMLFNGTVGVLAALFLGVSPYFVAIGHFATIDTPANFWYWLSCLFALLSWKKKSGAWFAVACGTAGMTVGMKIDRLVVIVPLLLSYVLKRESGTGYRNLLKFVPVALAGYVLANPALLSDPFQFLDGTTRDLFFNMGRAASRATTSFVSLLSDMKSGMGLLLFLAAVTGLGYAVWNFLFHKDRIEVGWLLSCLVPYYLLMGSHLSLSWYAPFFFPGLAVFAAYGCRAVEAGFPPVSRVAARAIPVLIVSYSLWYSLSIVLQFQYDSRYLAAEWIEQQVPAGSTIKLSSRGPAISDTRYQTSRISESMAFDNHLFARTWRDRLEQNTRYQAIRQGIMNLEQWTAAVTGRPGREKPYEAWFDREEEQFARKRETMGTAGTLEDAEADFVVLVRYLHEGRISGLLLPTSGYRLVKIFHYENPIGIQKSFPFVNPEVYVFTRIPKSSSAISRRRESMMMRGGEEGIEYIQRQGRLCRR